MVDAGGAEVAGVSSGSSRRRGSFHDAVDHFIITDMNLEVEQQDVMWHPAVHRGEITQERLHNAKQQPAPHLNNIVPIMTYIKKKLNTK